MTNQVTHRDIESALEVLDTLAKELKSYNAEQCSWLDLMDHFSTFHTALSEYQPMLDMIEDLTNGQMELQAEIDELRDGNGGPEVITVAHISKDIQDWRFNEDVGGKFGEYLRDKYPNGLIIKGDE